MKRLTYTDSEYKHLANHLFFNLNKDFKRFYKATKNTVANSIACTGIGQLTADEMYERKVTFITYILPELVVAGATKHDYLVNQSLVLNAYKNMMIDIWRKNNTEKKYIVHLETTYTDDGEEMNPINNIADTTAPYNNLVDRLETAIDTFTATLNAQDKLVMSYIRFPGSDAQKRVLLEVASEELGVSQRTFFRYVKDLKVRASTFFDQAN